MFLAVKDIEYRTKALRFEKKNKCFLSAGFELLGLRTWSGRFDVVTATLATTILILSRVAFKIKIYSQCRNLFVIVLAKKHGAGHLKPSYICTFESIAKRAGMSLQEARHYRDLPCSMLL